MLQSGIHLRDTPHILDIWLEFVICWCEELGGWSVSVLTIATEALTKREVRAGGHQLHISLLTCCMTLIPKHGMWAVAVFWWRTHHCCDNNDVSISSLSRAVVSHGSSHLEMLGRLYTRPPACGYAAVDNGICWCNWWCSPMTGGGWYIATVCQTRPTDNDMCKRNEMQLNMSQCCPAKYLRQHPPYYTFEWRCTFYLLNNH